MREQEKLPEKQIPNREESDTDPANPINAKKRREIEQRFADKELNRALKDVWDDDDWDED